MAQRSVMWVEGALRARPVESAHSASLMARLVDGAHSEHVDGLLMARSEHALLMACSVMRAHSECALRSESADSAL